MVQDLEPPGRQADLAIRLALRLRPRRRPDPRDRNLSLALALLRRTGATPPEHDPLVVGWVSGEARIGELRSDPLLGHLLPRIFEAEGVGRALRDEGNGTHQHMWRALAAALPSLLPAPPARNGRPTTAHTDLVALAVRLARRSEARGEIPGLAAFAAANGSSRILGHARALHEQLSSG